mmetsp:Transcript_24213/g.69812  ORF Transcript_24213/g.69812 Transcript_24213/m.69812 type:complete len:467 (+) Transcript_24213:172-1572(+)
MRTLSLAILTLSLCLCCIADATSLRRTQGAEAGSGGYSADRMPDPAEAAEAAPVPEVVDVPPEGVEEIPAPANVTANATAAEEIPMALPADPAAQPVDPAAGGGTRLRRLQAAGAPPPPPAAQVLQEEPGANQTAANATDSALGEDGQTRRLQDMSAAGETSIPEVAQNLTTNTTGATRRLQETGAAEVPVGAPEAVEAANMTNATDPATGMPAGGSTRRLQDLGTLPAEQTPVEANVTANATEGTTEGGVRRMQDLGGAAPPPPEANVTTNMSDAAVQPPDAGTRRMQTVGGADAAQQQAGYVAAEEQAMANVTNATDPVSQGGTRRMQDNMGGVMEMPVNETNTTTEGQMGQGQGGIRRRRLQTFDGAEGPDAAGTEMRDDSLGYDAAQTEDQAESVSGGVPQQGTEVGAGAAGAGAGEEDFPTAEEITPAPEEVLAEPEQQVPGFLEGELVGGPDSEARTGGE